MEKLKRTFIVEIKYPECDKLVNAEDYLQELIEGDLVGDDVGRWCVNVKEKADAYVGHPYEIDEGSHITNVRQAYIDGYNACLRRWRQTIYQKK